MSSSTTSALSRQPRPRFSGTSPPPGSAGLAPQPVHGPIPGCDGGARRLPEPDGDMGARHRPDRRRPAVPRGGGGTGSSVGVDHPPGAAGPGPHRPQHPSEVMVLHTHRHHRRKNSHRGGRQDHARGPPGAGLGAAPPVGPGPRHGRRADPAASSRQFQRDPRAQRASRTVGPGRGGGDRRCDAHPGGHSPVDHPAWRSLPSHRQGQPEDSAPYSQGPALEERPIRLERRHRPRAAGAAYCQGRRGSHFPGAAQVVQVRRTRTIKSRKHVEWSTRVCSLSMPDAQPEQVAAWIQGHWGIENRLHWVRDVIFDEDRHQLRTANGPQVMAALRNLAISLIRLAHGAQAAIASTIRSLSRQPKRAIKLITQPTT